LTDQLISLTAFESGFKGEQQSGSSQKIETGHSRRWSDELETCDGQVPGAGCRYSEEYSENARNQTGCGFENKHPAYEWIANIERKTQNGK